jgi:hypothetical protein
MVSRVSDDRADQAAAVSVVNNVDQIGGSGPANSYLALGRTTPVRASRGCVEVARNELHLIPRTATGLPRRLCSRVDLGLDL